MTDSEKEGKIICFVLSLISIANGWTWYKLSQFYKVITDEYSKKGGIYNFWNAKQIIETMDYKNAACYGGTVLVITSIATIWSAIFLFNKSKKSNLKKWIFILWLVSFILACFAIKYWIFGVIVVAVAAGVTYLGYGDS